MGGSGTRSGERADGTARRADDSGRSGESPLQRADRNMIEMLQELRVAQTGIQILFAFLLSLSFTDRFERIDEVPLSAVCASGALGASWLAPAVSPPRPGVPRPAPPPPPA